MKATLFAGLLVVLSFGILTLWAPATWPLAAFQLGAFILCTLAMLRNSVSLPYPAAVLGLAAVWGVLQILFRRTEGYFATASAAASWAALLALFLAAVNVFEDPHARKRARAVMLWFAFVVSAGATLQTFTSEGKVFWMFPTEYSDKVMGPILSRNHYAAWIELILPVALFRAFGGCPRALLHTGMAATMYASVIASGSRAGMVLCTVEVLLVPVLIVVGNIAPVRDVGAVTAKLAGALATFTAVVGWDTTWRRLTESDPYFLRREFVESCFSMIRDQPWFGFGLGTWPAVYPAYAMIDVGAFANRAHNDWLEWAADGGIPFALLLLAIALWSVRPAFRTVWGLGVVSVFLHALVDYPFSRPQLAGWTIVIIAMLAAADKRVDAAPCSPP